MLRRIFLLLVIMLAIGPVPPVHQRFPVPDSSMAVAVRPVAGVTPGMRIAAARVGEAWHLVSADHRFGGFSAMVLAGERRFQLFTDRGDVWDFDLSPGGALANMVHSPLLPTYPGGPTSGADVESAYRDPASGRIWLGIEGRNQIWRLEPDLSVSARRRRSLIEEWPGNSGPEAMTRLADRRVMVLSEGADDDPRGLEAVMFRGDPTRRRTRAFRFFYDPGDMGRPTSAAALPDGRALILHRTVRPGGVLGTVGVPLAGGPPFHSVLAIADPRGIGPNDVLRGRALVVLDSPELAENWEAMATVPRPDGGVSVWLASDDNFTAWQRSLLIRLDFDAAALAARAPDGAPDGKGRP